jgi:hypothetical protein
MEAVNNLIYDECISSKICIAFSNIDQLEIIFGLMKEAVPIGSEIFQNGGVVSFFHMYQDPFTKIRYRVRQFYTKEFDDYIILNAEEFFTLALPCKSILESIK